MILLAIRAITLSETESFYLSKMSKKLLFLTHETFWPLTGGGTAGSFHIMKHLANNGFDITISAPFHIAKEDFERMHNFTVEPFAPFYMHRMTRFRTAKYIIYSLLSFFHLSSLLLREKFDVIYMNNTVIALPILFLRPFIKPKLVLRYTDFLSGFLRHEKSCPRWMVAILQYYEYRIAIVFDQVHVITERMKGELCKVNKRRQEKFKVTFDGVEDSIFDMSKIPANNRQQIRRKLNIPDEAILVLFHGTIELYNGAQVIPEITQKVTSLDKDLYFLYIGIGKEYPNIKNQLKNNTHVRTLDFVEHSQIPKYIDASDIGIIPYLRNKHLDCVLTLKMLEYLSLGNPCVLFELGSIKDIFGRYDFVKIASNTDDFVDKVILLKSFKKSQSAMNIIKKDFTWEKVADRIRDNLLSLLDNP